MNAEFDSIRNHHEAAVIARISEHKTAFAHLAERGFLPDVACVALNRLPARYIRHAVDFSFYLSDKERADNERLIADAVDFAFEFVQARVAMRARG